MEFNPHLLGHEPNSFTMGRASLTARKVKLEAHQVSNSPHFFVKDV